MTWEIKQGDALEVLRTMPADSVHCVATSPPYWNLRDYGTGTWEGGDPACDHQAGASRRDEGERTWDGGPVHGGPRYFRDVCGRCGAVRTDRQIGLEATPELFIERLVEVFREVRRVLHPSGTIWINMGDCYATNPKIGDLKPKDLIGQPWMLAFALRDDGWYLRSDVVWAKPNPMPESVTDRPTKSHEYLFLLTKSARYFYDAEAVREPAIHAGRVVEYDGSQKNCSAGDGANDRRTLINRTVTVGERRSLRDVWTIATEACREAHFATFPKRLVEPCVLAGTSEKGCCPTCLAPWDRILEPTEEYAKLLQAAKAAGTIGQEDREAQGKIGSAVRMESFHANAEAAATAAYVTKGWRPTCSCPPAEPVPCTVLDPFAGSGTTLLVALRHGRRALGIELNPRYVEIARRRIVDDAPLFNAA